MSLTSHFFNLDSSVRVDGGFDPVTGVPRSCPKIRLAYALVAMCSHDCSPNTWRNILGSDRGFRHDLKAKRKIKKGEKICISYEDMLAPNLIRAQQLLEVKCLFKRSSKYVNIYINRSSVAKCKIYFMGGSNPC